MCDPQYHYQIRDRAGGMHSNSVHFLLSSSIHTVNDKEQVPSLVLNLQTVKETTFSLSVSLIAVSSDNFDDCDMVSQEWNETPGSVSCCPKIFKISSNAMHCIWTL